MQERISILTQRTHLPFHTFTGCKDFLQTSFWPSILHNLFLSHRGVRPPHPPTPATTQHPRYTCKKELAAQV